MKTTEQIEILSQYFATRIQVGHTHTMLNGAVNNDCLVLVPSCNISRALGLGSKGISLSELPKLYGTAKPLVIDHSALSSLFSGVLEEINELKEEILMLKNHK